MKTDSSILEPTPGAAGTLPSGEAVSRRQAIAPVPPPQRNETALQSPAIPACVILPMVSPPAHAAPESAPDDSPATATERAGRPNGKVARLPKTLRDQLNHWLLDGVSYPDIIERLGEHGKDLTPDNISQWKKRAHQQWLLEQAFIDRTRARQETPHDLVRDFDGTEVNHAALQLGALHMFEALRDLGPGSLDQKLGGDSAAFFRLINALARASRETMLLQKYREACARARAALRPLKDPKRKLSEGDRRAIVRHVDDILGLEPVEDEEPGAEVQPPGAEVGEHAPAADPPQEGKGEEAVVERQSAAPDRGAAADTPAKDNEEWDQ